MVRLLLKLISIASIWGVGFFFGTIADSDPAGQAWAELLPVAFALILSSPIAFSVARTPVSGSIGFRRFLRVLCCIPFIIAVSPVYGLVTLAVIEVCAIIIAEYLWLIIAVGLLVIVVVGLVMIVVARRARLKKRQSAPPKPPPIPAPAKSKRVRREPKPIKVVPVRRGMRAAALSMLIASPVCFMIGFVGCADAIASIGNSSTQMSDLATVSLLGSPVLFVVGLILFIVDLSRRDMARRTKLK